MGKVSCCSVHYLKCNLADRAYCFPCQLLIDVIDILRQLCGNIIGIGLISNGSQDVQLQVLDVGRLVDAAVEGGVNLQGRS